MAFIPIEQVSCLRPTQKQSLQQYCGVVYCHDILGKLTSSQIVDKSSGRMDLAEAQCVIDAVRDYCSRETLIPLRKLLSEEISRDCKRVATFSRELDALLGGGVPLGHVSEFCGAPGVGKTQLSLQLGVSCFLPRVFGGIQAEQGSTGRGQSISCWYIDTEGSFCSSRYREVACAAVAQVTRIAHQQHWGTSMPHEDIAKMRAEAQAFSVESILKNTHVSRVCEMEQFLALVRALPSMLRQNPSVKLLVIDSVAFPFRSALTNTDTSAMPSNPTNIHRMLSHVGHMLGRIAADLCIAVVVTNQMTTRVSQNSGGGIGASELVPALGDSWAHSVGTRVILRAPTAPSVIFSNDNGAAQLRYAELQKSPTELRGECSFLICGAGVRNAPR